MHARTRPVFGYTYVHMGAMSRKLWVYLAMTSLGVALG